jgi:Holliday junction DNA helicase RuvA
MIGRIRGEIVYQGVDYLLVDVQGVAYKIENFAPYRFGKEGDQVIIAVHTHIRETELRLFGFQSQAELSLFNSLLSVSGVGPKSAMLLVSNYSVRQIVESVENKDSKSISVKGLGTKTIEKVIIELQGKLLKVPEIAAYLHAEYANTEKSEDGEPVAMPSIKLNELELYQADLVAALASLGYKPAEFEKHLMKIDYRKSFSEQMKEMLSYIA